MKKKQLFRLSALAFILFTACDKDDVDHGGNEEPNVNANGKIACLLNQGSYTGLEGGLNVVDLETSEIENNVFKKTNGRTLGNTPQCGVIYGSKMYIGMSESKTIEVVDKSTFKSIKQIRLDNSESGNSPRSMLANGGKVYISMYEGYVARLDTISLSIDGDVKVGPNPETMCLHQGKLYVPNSNGMGDTFGTTASVVTLSPFAEEKQIAVPLNPSKFMSDGETLYLLCRGDYMNIASALYKIGASSNEKIVDATDVAFGDSKIVIANNPYTAGESLLTYKILDTKTGEIKVVNFPEVPAPSGMGINSKTGTIIISSYEKPAGMFADYMSPGYACEYDKDLNFVKRYNIGIGPVAIFFNDQN